MSVVRKLQPLLNLVFFETPAFQYPVMTSYPHMFAAACTVRGKIKDTNTDAFTQKQLDTNQQQTLTGEM